MNCNQIERQVYPALCQKESLFCFYLDGLWKDLGLPHTFIQGSKDFIEYISKLEADQSFVYNQGKTSNLKVFNDYYLIDNQYGLIGLNLIHKSYLNFKDNEVENLMLKTNNKIGPYCVIESGCLFFKDVTIKNSVIMKNSCFKSNIVVSDSILGGNVLVEDDSQILELSVIGFGYQVKSKSIIKGQKLSM